MSTPPYYAHSNGSPGRKDWHALSAHLEDTGARAAKFLEPTGCANLARAAGLLHDIGKYTPQFQSRLAGDTRRVNHSTAGARIAIDRYGPKLGKVLAFCIAGHHTGLANGVDGDRVTALTDRLCEVIPAVDPIWKREITLPQGATPSIRPRDDTTVGFSAALLVRMVFSALVDADFLDTEAYFASLQDREPLRGRHPALAELVARLDAHLVELMAGAPVSEANKLRREVLSHVRGKAVEVPGLFTLTVPTGGGKTLTSLTFALDHAVYHGLARVIYVIPYTSIIEQTAAVFRDALRSVDDEADFVVEHHSTFDEDRIGKREAKDKLRLAMENWDAPIIVTTAVQFFESLFANRSSRCRKLHNIANSVVILDEAQTLPLKLLRPCVAVLDELARNWRTSIVLCTATQPALGEADGFRDGFQHLRELSPEPQRLFQTLKRTRIRDHGEMDDATLTKRLSEWQQALCIVNTRRHARELYELLADIEGAVHLTTLMCARHRREKLEMVNLRLKEGAPVRLVATSLVEAGVDVDFPVVWRAEAGLESIIQAAGRCNREGHQDHGDVFVFTPSDGEGRKPPAEVTQFADAARSVMRHHDDPMSLDAINAYFRELYWNKGDDALDAKGILRLFRERRTSLDFPFETVAREFRLIETTMVPVIVPYQGTNGDDETVASLLDELNRAERPGGIARRLQPYVVQIPPSVRVALLAVGAAEVVRKESFSEQFVVLANSDLYDKDVGLTWEDPTFRKAEGLMH